MVGLSLGEKNPPKNSPFDYDYDRETMLAMVVVKVRLSLGEKNPQGAKAPTFSFCNILIVTMEFINASNCDG